MSVRKLVLISLFLVPGFAQACPFCDLGAKETALFILVFFGLIAMGMSAFFVIFLRSGALKNAAQLNRKAIDAENPEIIN